ncbi:MATE family efflux transporter [Magnetospirillum sulfuroxidans]|uniref:Multidrug-efflux transporter n=1 Tax=Magnetospirillum sulfuroxidans TaxID=611300 RepID=A0ABS5IBH4_9PROT|nr:MATE family efflux transporter [Magnetospirillum sulfuroxidans]MBR9971780.1 MATE family efflux transporter [Magnetospirillum sulfuroxidans]
MNTSPSRWRAEAAAMLSLGWPIILTNLAQIAIGTTDTVMMGWLGPTDLAAGTLGANLYFGWFVMGIGLVLGTSPMLAQTLGARRHAVRECRRIVRQGLWLAGLYSLPVWVVLWHTETILGFLGQDPALTVTAGAYGRAVMWGLLPALGMIALRSFIAAQERPRAAMVVTVLAVGLNAGVNWLLMFGHWGLPAMGVVGAGVASSLSNAFMFIALLGFILADRRFRRFHLLGRLWRSDWPKFKELLRVGGPMGLAMGFEVSGFNAAAFLMGVIDAPSLAAHAIALQVASVTFMVPMGLAQAATVRVGLAAGAGNADGVRKAGWTALVLSSGFMVLMAVVLIVWPQAIVSAFLDLERPDTAVVLSHALVFLAVAALFQVVDGAQVVGAGALRGLKDTRVPMIFAGLGYWGLGIPIGALLAFGAGMGGLGIWIGLAIGLAVVAALVTLRWSLRRRLDLLKPYCP